MRNPAALIRISECMPVDAMPLLEPAETEARRIVRGLRRKDMALINQLVERYQYRLVRYLLYVTGRRERVEDLVQDTWLRVLDRGSQFDGRSRFEPWLFSIARNLAIDDLRKRKIVSLDTREADTPEAVGPQEALAGELPTPDQSRIHRGLALLRSRWEGGANAV
jgi:RNA polymerase sigma-70 factor, ECF subfamily